jgi:hypothetical protein
MDDLRLPKTPAVNRLIEARGAKVWCLTPYSPDLNPFEMAFATLKSPLRRETVRPLETLDPAVARSLASFLPHHGQNFFRPAHFGTV